MKLTDPLEERVIFDLREIVYVVSGVNMGCQLSWVGCLMVNNGCSDDGMTCHEMMHMHASCMHHATCMSMTCP